MVPNYIRQSCASKLTKLKLCKKTKTDAKLNKCRLNFNNTVSHPFPTQLFYISVCQDTTQGSNVALRPMFVVPHDSC